MASSSSHNHDECTSCCDDNAISVNDLLQMIPTEDLLEAVPVDRVLESVSTGTLVKELMRRNQSKSRSNQFNMFPITDDRAFEFYKRQEGAVWSVNELDYIRDKVDFQNLNDKEKRLIKLIFGFFAPGDGLVAKNLTLRFLLEAPNFESSAMLAWQLAIEVVHGEAYGMLIESLLSEEDKREVFSMVDSLPCVIDKAQFMEKYLMSDLPESERFIAFACAEGIFFSVLFAVIFWFRSRGVMSNMIFINEQIAKDETLHRDYGIYRYLQARDNERPADIDAHNARVTAIVREAVEIEERFVDVLMETGVDGLSADLLKKYARSVADQLLVLVGQSRVYQEANPLPWMEEISLQQKTNFYDRRVGAYKQFSLKNALDWRTRAGQNEQTVDALSNPEDIDV